MTRWALAALVTFAAAACSSQDRPLTYRQMDDLSRRTLQEQINRPPPDTCQMAAHQSLIGTVGAEIDQTTLPPLTRVICHDCVVTMDYRADRLNIDLAPDGKVVRLHCG
ncbi:MAG: I78 family peptidase inhibitor [Caulobacteraceae bacterium]